jgi:hypothetical protein
VTFKEWFLQQPLADQYERHYSHEEIWEAATLAERERCVEEVLYILRGDQVNFGASSGDVGQYYSGKVNALEEVLDAIRNP